MVVPMLNLSLWTHPGQRITLSSTLIHSLVQTEAHARALLSTSLTLQLDERVADRLARRSILTRPDPPVVKILLGEAALHTQVGGAEVMREQLQHLLDATALPSVSIRIMPFSAGAHVALGVGFRIVKVRRGRR
jgi:Domain of unknown function (DUF5753)